MGKKSRCLLLNGKEDYKEILFIGKNFFIEEETINKQNYRVYAWSSKEVRELVSGIEQGHYAASVVVW
jgi:hypothetical protein